MRVTDFTSDRYKILTGSDDYTCRLWDIPNAAQLCSYQEHTDYIRCGVASKLSRDLFITGQTLASGCGPGCSRVCLCVCVCKTVRECESERKREIE